MTNDDSNNIVKRFFRSMEDDVCVSHTLLASLAHTASGLGGLALGVQLAAGHVPTVEDVEYLAPLLVPCTTYGVLELSKSPTGDFSDVFKKGFGKGLVYGGATYTAGVGIGYLAATFLG